MLAHLKEIDRRRDALEAEVGDLANFLADNPAAEAIVRDWMDAGGATAVDFERWLGRNPHRRRKRVPRRGVIRLVVDNA